MNMNRELLHENALDLDRTILAGSRHTYFVCIASHEMYAVYSCEPTRKKYESASVPYPFGWRYSGRVLCIAPRSLLDLLSVFRTPKLPACQSLL